MIADLIYSNPPWAVALAFFAIGSLFVVACRRLAPRVLGPGLVDLPADLANSTTANMAVIYGVLLAFLSVVSWEGLSKAADNVDLEAGFVTNLFYDAQGLDIAPAHDVDDELRAYLRDVIDVEWPLQIRGGSPDNVSPAIVRLHRSVSRLSPADSRGTVVMADMLRVLNELDSARATRIADLDGHIPALVWSVIIGMGALLIACATLIPSSDHKAHAGLLGGFVLAITLALLMTVELDYPFRGNVSVSVEPFRRALADMDRPVASAILTP